MKKIETAKIEEKALSLFQPLAIYDFYQEDVTAKVVQNGDQVLIEVGCQYDSPNRNEAALKTLRRFLGAKHIDVHYDISEPGCDTCDYGSRYGYAVRAWG